MLSRKVRNIAPSLTLAISSKAKTMKKEGLDVIGFGAGEPDFDTPKNIKEKAKEAIDNGFTKYTPSSGLPELKEAIIEKFKKDNNLFYNKEEILVGCGAKHVIFEIIFSLVDEKEEVIIPSPYWVSYPEMVKIAGGVCVFLETKKEDGFKIDPDSLKKHITKNTKLLILNSPCNPTGAVYTKQELKSIANILEEYNIFCLSDEIYEKLVYDGIEHVSIASLSDKTKERTIVVNGVSKAYSMTGWRIGYAAGPKQIIKAASNLQSHSTSNPTSISQMAAIEALRGDQKEVYKMREEFRERRDYMVDRLNKIRGLSCLVPQGAFYCFVDISNLFGKRIGERKIESSFDFSETLLEEEKVAVVPGVAFGNDSYIRLSYATSLENIRKGLDRLERFVNRLTY